MITLLGQVSVTLMETLHLGSIPLFRQLIGQAR
jgi:hypothetical protein